jgi:spore maturation protein CgeB
MAAGGAVALQQRSPGLEDATGIVDGEHVLLWDTLDDLTDLVEAYRKRPNERARIACQAQQLAHERHSFRSRVQQVLTYVEQMEGA